MITRTWIFEVLHILLLVGPGRVSSILIRNHTCEKFEEGASFDPYVAINAKWKIFYHWADFFENSTITFFLPNKNSLNRFKREVKAIDPSLEMDWQRATLMMRPRPGTLVLFLSDGYPGSFRALVKVKNQVDKVRPHQMPEITLADVRIKNNRRYIGMMGCENISAYALAQIDDMPLTEMQCERAAASLGLSGPGGKSYLQALINKRVVNDEL